MYPHNLRVGNIVKDTQDDLNDSHLVHSIPHTFLDYPSQERGYLIQLTPFGREGMSYAMPETVVPKKLNAWWLRKLGFKTIFAGKDYWYELRINDECAIITNDSLFNQGLDEWHLGIQYHDCDTYFDEHWNSVHIAQNIYHLHTGKDIAINHE